MSGIYNKDWNYAKNVLILDQQSRRIEHFGVVFKNRSFVCVICLMMTQIRVNIVLVDDEYLAFALVMYGMDDILFLVSLSY